MSRPSTNDSPAARPRPAPIAPRSWQQRASPLARYGLFAYLLIVVDASLFPFAGWRDLGFAPYDYLLAPWPPRALPFDLTVNVLGYLPLGFVCGLALHPRLRGAAAVFVSTIFCAFVSIHLEALQTYLPSRVASQADVATNVLGGAIGALVAARFAHALLDTGRLRVWRTRWFRADASRGMVLCVLWWAALVYPDAFVFGTGGLLKALDPAASSWLAAFAGLADLNDPVATAVHFEMAETAVSTLTLLGAGLLFLNLLRPGSSWFLRTALLLAFVAATLGVVVLARAFLLENPAAWSFLTAGARDGLVAAAALLVLATAMPPRFRWAPGVVALAGAIVLVNVCPDNPYVGQVNLAWTRGKLMNFYGLASGLNLVWPYLAIVYLLRHRGSPTARGRGRTTVVAREAVGGSPL